MAPKTPKNAATSREEALHELCDALAKAYKAFGIEDTINMNELRRAASPKQGTHGCELAYSDVEDVDVQVDP